jgi:hypothetical protein
MASLLLRPPARSYGANVDAFLSAVSDTAGASAGAAGRSGLGALDAAREAASAVKVVEALNAIRELLRQQTADVAAAGRGGVDDSRATFLNLAALLSVTNGTATKKFDASEWSLTEAEAVRIARVFARYDGADSRLDASQLRRLMDELGQPLSDAEAKVAMGFLDEDGNGVVDFNEFVAYWAGTRRIKPPAQPKQQ